MKKYSHHSGLSRVGAVIGALAAGLVLSVAVVAAAQISPATTAALATVQDVVQTSTNPNKPDAASWIHPDFAYPEASQSQLRAVALDSDLAADADGNVMIIVQLTDPDVVSYEGGLPGLEATSPKVTGAIQFDAQTPAAQAYMNYLADQQANFASAVAQVSPQARVLANYQAALNGVALKLPFADLAAVAQLPGVRALYKNEINHLDTDVGPTWIGAPSIWAQLGGQANAGEGVIIGVIDGGSWSPNPITPTLTYTDPLPSYDGTGYAFPFTSLTGITYTDYLGVCAPSGAQASDGTFVCTNKLIGGYWYNAGGIALPAEYDSPLDQDGHGTHTSSTAGGNVVSATIQGNPLGTISGVTPRARIIAYKVCWNENPADAQDGGCSSVDSVSAINQAILNGVHVLNYSISGGTSPTTDAVELAFLSARNAGIFVSTSAGNTGPGAGTVAHRSPWLNTSAAMQHDRTFRSDVVLTSTFTISMPNNLRGSSIASPYTGTIVLAPVQAGDPGFYPSRCLVPYAPGTFTAGEIVVCRRGINARVEKAANVATGGAGGFVLVNATANQGLALDTFIIPGVHLEQNATSFSQAGEDLVTFLLAATPTNTVTGAIGSFAATKQGDVMASFSSRGPSGLSIIKPDNAAPGVEILAGNAQEEYETYEVDGNLFAFFNGTSMSSPHTAGAGALLKALHPDWTPAEIQSALMTGAVEIVKENGTTPGDPFDYGAGRLNLTNSMMPGLLFNETGTNYQAYVSGTLAIENLNIPSLAQTQCAGLCSWTRTAENVYTATSTYTWAVVSATPGLTVTLDQVSYTVNAGATFAFTATADVGTLPLGTYAFARIVMHDSASGAEVAIPVAVLPAAGVLPQVDISTPRDSGGQDFTGQNGSALSPVVATIYGVADPQLTAGFAVGGDDADWDTNPLDPAFGWFLYTDTIPANTGRYVINTSNSTIADIDLAVLIDLNQNGVFQWPSERVAFDADGDANETVDLANLQAYAGYELLVGVYNWLGTGDADFDLRLWRATPTDGSLSVAGLPGSLSSGQVFTATAVYDHAMLEGETYYGLINIGTTGDETALGSVPVDIHRTDSEVKKTVDPTSGSALPGTVLTYTIVIENQDSVTRNFAITDVIPAGTTYVSGSLTGPNAVYDSGLNAILVSATVPGQIAGSDYVVEDSLTDPSLVSQSPFGGFLDLTAFGAPAARADNSLFIYTDVGCGLSFYDSANATPNAFQFATNGLVGPRAGMTVAPGPVPSPIPTVGQPDAFIAANWNDVSITNTVGITNAGRLGFVLSFGTPTCPTDYYWAFQFNRLHKKSDPSQVMDVQYVYNFAEPDIHWVQYGVVSGTFGAADGSVVGSENFAGTSGVAYTGPITSGLLLKYSRSTMAAPPITITFQVTLDNLAPGIITNVADYTVDAPYTTMMEVTAVYASNKLYLPIIRR